ncbi:hypothetical protein H0H10_23270 [Streptomyces sp. TRM S81-3]|uniref:Uncharacterized protein n=1 Tax=Streptomyces griseicoloratus TaxID=2752516 RepID=A0A926L5Z0_9ACTN|nr:hypothetical protein [Streptomyces griseicoloratus]MBD0422039.1 hypothetical protein [Streptomyces griseicoloratus]
MAAGPEATVVAKAAGTVLRGLSERATATPAWPGMHEALLELHEILDDWCQAAQRTGEALERLRSQHLTRSYVAYMAGVGNGGGRSVRFLGIPLRQGYIETAQRDIRAIMEPPAPVAQRWSPARRRQAARRTLRRLMGIYCPDLLESFHRAVEGRVDWVTRHRHDIDHALTHGLQPGTLADMIREATRTTTALASARDDIKRLILERYPMGTATAGGDTA